MISNLINYLLINYFIILFSLVALCLLVSTFLLRNGLSYYQSIEGDYNDG